MLLAVTIHVKLMECGNKQNKPKSALYISPSIIYKKHKNALASLPTLLSLSFPHLVPLKPQENLVEGKKINKIKMD